MLPLVAKAHTASPSRNDTVRRSGHRVPERGRHQRDAGQVRRRTRTSTATATASSCHVVSRCEPSSGPSGSPPARVSASARRACASRPCRRAARTGSATPRRRARRARTAATAQAGDGQPGQTGASSPVQYPRARRSSGASPARCARARWRTRSSARAASARGPAVDRTRRPRLEARRERVVERSVAARRRPRSPRPR